MSQRDGEENYNNAKNIYSCRPSSLFWKWMPQFETQHELQINLTANLINFSFTAIFLFFFMMSGMKATAQDCLELQHKCIHSRICIIVNSSSFQNFFFSNSFFDLFVTPLNRLVDDGNQLYHAAKESEVASRESRRL